MIFVILLNEVIIKLLGSFHFTSRISKLHAPSATYSLLLTCEALFEKSFEDDCFFGWSLSMSGNKYIDSWKKYVIMRYILNTKPAPLNVCINFRFYF